MLQEAYWERIQRFTLPTEKETLDFVKRFTYAHSWYKHLSWKELQKFVFYLDPKTGKWDYFAPLSYYNHSAWDEEDMLTEEKLMNNENFYGYFLPTELAEKGIVMLNAFIHNGFRDNEPYREAHLNQIENLTQTLLEVRQIILGRIKQS